MTTSKEDARGFDRYPPLALTPLEFEKEVKQVLDAMGAEIHGYNSVHREKLDAADGLYEIDITIRLVFLGVDFLVLVECKHHKNSIKRELVQALHSKILSVGAQKGILFSSSNFQSGTISFASAHGIALVKLEDGRSTYFTKSFGDQPVEPPPWVDIEPVIGWLIEDNCRSVISRADGRYLSKFLQKDN